MSYLDRKLAESNDSELADFRKFLTDPDKHRSPGSDRADAEVLMALDDEINRR